MPKVYYNHYNEPEEDNMTDHKLNKTHELLEKLANYVMNEVPTKKEVDERFRQIENELDQKADKKDLFVIQEDLLLLKENVALIINGMDAVSKNLDDMRIEQKAFISGLQRLEDRVEKLEKETH